MIGSDQVLNELSENFLASDALLAVSPPPLAPAALDNYALPSSEFELSSDGEKPEMLHAKASWLDAMPVQPDPLDDLIDGVASVNEDEVGLYHMFVGVTP